MYFIASSRWLWLFLPGCRFPHLRQHLRTSGKQPVLPADHKGADTVLRKGIADGAVSIPKIVEELLPVVQGILESGMELRLWQFPGRAYLCPRPESLEKRLLAVKSFFFLLSGGRPSSSFSISNSLFRRTTLPRVLKLSGHGCLWQRVYKSAAQMGVAQASCDIPDSIVPGISIRMDISGIAF